jgi:hypothetical protein
MNEPADLGRAHLRVVRPSDDPAATAMIRLEWVQHVIEHPLREVIQADGRIRRWARIEEMEGRYLRVVLLPDGETVHNAFFDRSFEP